MALQIEYCSPASLTPYARNARTHSAAQVEQIAASIREFGFNSPVLVDATGEVIAGHGRLAAAKQLKLERVPVVRLGHLTEAQKRAYVLADNKIALNAGWDEKLLADELKQLGAAGADLAQIGFSGDELLQLLGGVKAGRTDPDAAPALQETPVSRAGDVWELGTHRVVCGDVQAPGAVPSVMLGEQADVVWTDPPYNVAYKSRAGKIANDDMSDEAYAEFLDVAFGACFRALREGGGHLRCPCRHVRPAGSRVVRARGVQVVGCCYLAQGRAGAGPLGLPVAARADFVRVEARRAARLVRRPQADDGHGSRRGLAIPAARGWALGGAHRRSRAHRGRHGIG